MSARRKTKTRKEKSPQPAGLPAPENVREIVDFVSPQKVRYKILKTTEMDTYDKPAPSHRNSRKKRRR